MAKKAIRTKPGSRRSTTKKKVVRLKSAMRVGKTTRQTAAVKATKSAAKSSAKSGAKSAAPTNRGSATAGKPSNRRARSGENSPGARPAPPLRASRLSKAEIDEFRNLLLDKRRELLGDMNNLQNQTLRKNRKDASGDVSAMPTHMADIGSDNWEQEFTLGLIENERGLLQEIDEALERIGQGSYGVCLATNRPIRKTRLRAKPWAKYCIEYAREQERQQRRF